MSILLLEANVWDPKIYVFFTAAGKPLNKPPTLETVSAMNEFWRCPPRLSEVLECSLK